MAAHGVATDTASLGRGEMRFDQFRQLLHHVVMHAVVLGPRLLGRVEIKAGTLAEIPGAIRIARHLFAARAGIGRHDDQAQLGRELVRPGLLHEVLIGAGQPGQPIQHRQFAALLRLRRQVHGKHHVATQYRGMMLVTLVPAAEALLAGKVLKAHELLRYKLQASSGNTGEPPCRLKLAA
ncbi:hypothetical protein D3C81_1425140 [compost metagenome]